MNKKHIQTNAITSELEGASLFFAKPKLTPPPVVATVKREPTRKSTLNSTQVMDMPRELPRDIPREDLRDLPTRDDIQEFSFRLRDTFKVKIQAEVPYEWQGQLEEISRHLKVKKLELYRFILGNFLGEVKPRKGGH